jgi:hypothetical protein
MIKDQRRRWRIGRRKGTFKFKTKDKSKKTKVILIILWRLLRLRQLADPRNDGEINELQDDHEDCFVACSSQ